MVDPAEIRPTIITGMRFDHSVFILTICHSFLIHLQAKKSERQQTHISVSKLVASQRPSTKPKAKPYRLQNNAIRPH